jgi:putative transposase
MPPWPICGLPDVLQSDHGSDLTGQHLDQLAVDPRNECVFSTVGPPKERGKIERFFGAMKIELLLELSGALVERKTGSPLALAKQEVVETAFITWADNDLSAELPSRLAHSAAPWSRSCLRVHETGSRACNIRCGPCRLAAPPVLHRTRFLCRAASAHHARHRMVNTLPITDFLAKHAPPPRPGVQSPKSQQPRHTSGSCNETDKMP